MHLLAQLWRQCEDGIGGRGVRHKKPCGAACIVVLIERITGPRTGFSILIAFEPCQSAAQVGVVMMQPGLLQREYDEAGSIPVASRTERGTIRAHPELGERFEAGCLP